MNKTLYRISIALAILGTLVSVYMTIFKLTENQKMCLGNGGCSVVNSSSYSEVSGIPVALLGVGGYLAILAILLIENRIKYFKQNGTVIVFGLAIIFVAVTPELVVR